MKNAIINYSKKHDWFRIILKKLLFIKNYLLNFNNQFTKVDPHLIVFESYMGRAYDCSPRAIYENILEDERFNNYKFVWAFKEPFDNIEKPLKKDSRTTTVVYRSKEYYKFYGKAKYWITNSRLPEEIIKKKDQIYVQCWHGTPLKRLGHDVIDNTQNAMNNKKEINKRYDIESAKFDYFISPSAFASEKFKSAFNIKNERTIIEKGYPRNDTLLTTNKKDIEKLKIINNIPLDKKVILYTPTWRDNEHTAGLGYTYKIHADFDYLQEKLADEYVIIFRPHYLIANQMDLSKYKGFIFYDKSYMSNTNDLYLMSDILITDYSSSFFDFSNLNKPIIFYMYDLEFYKNELRGFYISLKELPGEIVLNDRQLVKTIKNIEKSNLKYKNIYKDFNKKYNYLDDGHAASRVIDIIIENKGV